MQLQDELLYLCCRQTLTSRAMSRLGELCRHITPQQWPEILQTAREHGTSPLIYHHIQQLPAAQQPAAARIQLKKHYIENLMRKKASRAALEKLLGQLNKQNIRTLIIKGGALSYFVYEQPWYTFLSDVDLVLERQASSFSASEKQALERPFHDHNVQDGQLKEHIEFDYYEHHDLQMNGVLAVDMKEIWREAMPASLHNSAVYLMGPEDMLIATAINCCRKRYFKLKNLADLVAILEKYPHLNWVKLLDKAQRYRCRLIVYTALRVTQQTIGCQVPESILTRLAPIALRRRLIERIISHLLENYSLVELGGNAGISIFNRTFSWPLLLTYASYELRQFLPKLREIYQGRHENGVESSPTASVPEMLIR